MTTIADRLKQLHADKAGDLGRELTHDEVADAVGIGRSYYTGILNGHDKPGRDTLRALADYFGVSVDWLQTGKGQPHPTPLDERTADLARKIEALSDHERGIVEQVVESFSHVRRD